MTSLLSCISLLRAATVKMYRRLSSVRQESIDLYERRRGQALDGFQRGALSSNASLTETEHCFFLYRVRRLHQDNRSEPFAQYASFWGTFL